MKVSQQTIHGFKLIAGGNEEIGLTAALTADCLAFKGTQARGAYRNHSAAIFLGSLNRL